MEPRTVASLALCTLILVAGANAQPPAATAVQPAASAASSPLRAHGYPIDGQLLSNPAAGYEVIVHSWESNTPAAPKDMRQVSYRMCSVRKNDPLYFQWPLAGFHTGPRGMLQKDWCAELDRLALGTVQTSPQATIDFTKQRSRVPHPTLYIAPPGLGGRFQAFVRLNGPASLRTDWSRGQRSFQMSTERKDMDVWAQNNVKWDPTLVVYVTLPRVRDEALQELRGSRGPRASPGAKAEVLAPSQVLVDFAEPSAVSAVLEGRSVLRLTPSDKGEASVDYNLQLQSKEMQGLPVLLRKRDSKEIFMLLRYDTPAP